MDFLKNSFGLRKIILSILILSSTYAKAQHNLTGILKNKDTGEPVAGATIYVDSSFLFTISDINGHFLLSGIKQNIFTITITHLSYTVEKRIVTSDNEIIFELISKSHLAEEVNISATRVNSRSTFAFTNIEKPEIEKNNLGQDLPYLLNLTPSVVATSDGGTGVGYTSLRIRGSDATRVNVTINGIPVNDAESHQVYWVDLPDISSSVENIQIQRGLGSSTNGTGAFGGSINILSTKLNAEPFAELNSTAGSFNTIKNTLLFGTGLLSNVFAIEGRFSIINSSGYIDRASSNLHSFYLSGGYYGKKNSLRAVAFSGKEKTYQAWYGITKDSLETSRTFNPAGEYYDVQGNLNYYDNQTDNYQQDNYQLLFSHEFKKLFTLNFALHYTRGKGYYEEYKTDESISDYNLSPINIGDSIITSMDLVRRLWLSNDFYGTTWSVDYEKGEINIKAGGAYNRYIGEHYGEVIASEIMQMQQYPYNYYKNDANKTDASIFIRSTYSPGELINLYLDLQERIVNYSFEGFNDELIIEKQNERNNFFNPKAGLSFLLSGKTQLYFSAGLGHKEPVRDDYISSTPSNRPHAEQMTDIETGIRYNSNKLSASLNGFIMNYKSQLILTGKINDVGEYIRESVNNSYRTGIELEGKINLSSKIYFHANISISRNRIKLYREYVDDYDGGPQIVNEYTNTSISFSPNSTGAAIVGFIPTKNFQIEFTGKYVGKQYLDNTTNETRKLDSYFTNDLNLSYTLHPVKIKEISFRFSLKNIFNQNYVSNGYTYSVINSGVRNDYNFYFPQAMLNWMVGVVVKV